MPRHTICLSPPAHAACDGLPAGLTSPRLLCLCAGRCLSLTGCRWQSRTTRTSCRTRRPWAPPLLQTCDQRPRPHPPPLIFLPLRSPVAMCLPCCAITLTASLRLLSLRSMALFFHSHKVTRNAQHVDALKAAGVILLGKANMHEIGQGVTGWNTHYGPARNPHNPNHFTGGSSSGSAALVAAGLCPVAIGADGGGSIRIPAAFCGLYGLVNRRRTRPRPHFALGPRACSSQQQFLPCTTPCVNTPPGSRQPSDACFDRVTWQIPTYGRTKEDHKSIKITNTMGTTGPIAGDARNGQRKCTGLQLGACG